MLTDLFAVGAHIKLLALIYFVTDTIISDNSQLIKIIGDEACHAATGVLLWSAVTMEDFDVNHSSLSTWRIAFSRHCMINAKELVLASFISCVLDIDHFIAAGSFSWHGATHLSSRPFGHALLFVPLVTGLIYILSKSSRTPTLIFVSLLSHQLRDAMRRGLWLWPLNASTPPIPYFLVFFLFLILIWSAKLPTKFSRDDDTNKVDQEEGLMTV